MEGIYKDIWIHLTFKFPENYPIKAPRCRLTPGQEFNQKYHHHLYGKFFFQIIYIYLFCLILIFFKYNNKGESYQGFIFNIYKLLILQI